MNRADYWPSAGHPPPNTVPLTSTYDGRKQVPQPTIPGCTPTSNKE